MTLAELPVKAATRPIKVVVVDDSLLVRSMLRAALEAEGDIQVAGAAKEPYEARDIIKATDPDVITLDVEMPGMNGLQFLEKIMTLRPTPVVMVSSLTSEGAEVTLAALEGGAVDFIAKPAGGPRAAEFGEMVRQKVRAASRAQVRAQVSAQVRAQVRAKAPARRAGAISKRLGSGPELIAIGASTGGVGAIGDIVNRLPHGLPPVTAVVHMPERYTARFAARLAQQTGHDVAEATDGERLEAGMFRIAPGSHHMQVERTGGALVTRLQDGPAISGHRPSVDVCFASVARSVGNRALGVILTGMGRDGAKGMLEMRNAGAMCLGEAESSCVVYGMPKAANEIGAVNEEHDLERMPGRISELAAGGPR
ncbi:MAG: chemotaxis response regulator protein-glutamate methylesterase [Pseudomonadota bacterium]